MATSQGGSLRKWLLVFLVCLSITLVTVWGLLAARERIGQKSALIHSTKSLENIPNIQSTLPTEVAESLNLLAGKKTLHTKKYLDEKLLYQAEYIYDGMGFRNSHMGAAKKKEHLIIAGCSFIFGEGMNETETLPYLLGQNLKGISVYNFGIAGSGPHDHNYYLSNVDLKDYIGSSDGKMIYFYMDDHTSRSSLYPSYLVWGGNNRPYYGFVEGNELPVLLGKSGDSPNWKQLDMARKAGLEKTFLELSYSRSSETQIQDLKLTAGLIANIQGQYLKQFPGNKFYFAFYPVFGSSSLHQDIITQELSRLGVSILDLNRVELAFQESSVVWAIPDDGHPNREANKKLADLMKLVLRSDLTRLTP